MVSKRQLVEEASDLHKDMPKWVVEAAVDLYLRDKDFFTAAMKRGRQRQKPEAPRPTTTIELADAVKVLDEVPEHILSQLPPVVSDVVLPAPDPFAL